MLDFTIHLTVRSVEQQDDDSVLVKVTERPYSEALRGGDASLFFVCAPGHAPTPGDVLKLTVETN